MAETVETAIYRLRVEGEDQIKRATTSIEGMDTAQEDATSSNRKLTQQIERGLTAFDQVLRAQQKYSKELELNARARESGASSEQKLAAHLAVTAQKYEEVTKAAEAAAIATEHLRRAQASATAGPGQAVGGVTGASTYAAEFDRMMTIAEGKAAQIGKAFGDELSERMVVGVRKSARDSAAAFSAELEKIDQIAHLKALQAGKNFQDTLNQSMGIGRTAKSARESFAVFDEAGMVNANKTMDQLGHSTKVARYEMINLGRQAQDVVVSLASGQNILMVGLQQGSQILDVFTSSERTAADMFKQMGSAIGSFLIHPLTLAAGAVTALVTATLALANAWDKVNVSSQRAISGAGARTGTTVSDINRFVEQNSGAYGGGLSQKEARGLAEDFTRTGDIVISKLRGMSDAVVGFSNQTGKSVDEAKKAMVGFATDPIKGMDELAKVYGEFDVATRKTVDAMVLAGDKTGAFQVVVDALAEKSRKAADNMGFLEKATRGFVNLLATETVTPAGIEGQLAAAQQRLSSFQPSGRRGSADLREMQKAVEDLQAQLDRLNAERAAAEINKLAKEATNFTASLTPQIAQIKQLEEAIAALERAKAAGAVSKYGSEADAAALQAAQNQLQALREIQAEAARYNQRVAEIAAGWQGVGQAVALQLQALQNELPVLQAVTGAQKMAAEYARDYANALKESDPERLALATANLAAKQAAANAEAERQVMLLKQQTELIEAQGTGREGAVAAAQAYDNTMASGADKTRAAAVQAATLEKHMAEVANKTKSASGFIDDAGTNTGKWKQEVTQIVEGISKLGRVSGSAAHYADMFGSSIYMGGQWTESAAGSAAVLADNMARVAKNAAAGADSMVSLNYSYLTSQNMANQGGTSTVSGLPSWTGTSQGGSFDVPQGERSGGILTEDIYGEHAFREQMYANIPSYSEAVNQQLASGGVNAAISYAQAQQPQTEKVDQYGLIGGWGTIEGMSDIVTQQAINESEILSQVSSLYDLQRSLTSDKATQTASMQAELNWLQSRPASVEQQKAIAALKQSIDQLTNSTDSLNATNQDLLSPYYTQDPRTSHIGFRSQGMASGGYVDVPGGISSNDNLMAMVPVASGERIYVDPMHSRRGGGGSVTVNISSPVLIQGNANKDEMGRTMFQANQAIAKQIRGALA